MVNIAIKMLQSRKKSMTSGDIDLWNKLSIVCQCTINILGKKMKEVRPVVSKKYEELQTDKQTGLRYYHLDCSLNFSVTLKNNQHNHRLGFIHRKRLTQTMPQWEMPSFFNTKIFWDTRAFLIDMIYSIYFQIMIYYMISKNFFPSM